MFGANLQAAPEFKIRYNPKFPCLEVMDGKSVKITDISEGTQGEVVTSGRSSIKLSFLKNASGEPEVTMTEAQSSLSEMELEAFGLSVGMKPAGIISVRFGPGNKPQFEMDRTGGARFLMADLGNLDTAAGKDLAGSAGTAVPETPKGLLRFRERLEAWKSSGGKGGWSNRPGKILACGADATVTYLGQAERKLLDGEAVQSGAIIASGTSSISFQSGPGIYHQLLPGGRAQLAPLESGQKDLKITLLQGTLLSQVIAPLVAPRIHVCSIGNGVVIQTSDGLFQLTSSGASGVRIAAAEGALRLVEEAGAAQVAEVTAGTVLAWPGEKSGKKLPTGSPEMATLNKLKTDSRGDLLVDMAEDAFKSASSEAEEIVQVACAADPGRSRDIALNLLEIRPDLRDLIAKNSGVSDLPAAASSSGEVQAFTKRAQPWLRAEPSPTSCVGRILWLEGDATYSDGLKLRRGMVMKTGDMIRTTGNGRVLILSAPGVIAEIQPGSTVQLVEMSGVFENGILQKSKSVLDASQGSALLSIVNGFGEKVQAELRTPQGVERAQSSLTKGKTL